MKKRRGFAPDYIHSAFFGFEDSLVSTTGVLAGISVGAQSTKTIFITGLVVIAVGSVSLGASEFISEETEEGVQKEDHPASPYVSGLVIFLACIAGGLIPLLPYLVLEKTTAIIVSVAAALLGLIVLGVLKGKIIHKSPLRSALEVFAVGGVSAAIGLAVGLIFKV